MAKAKSDAEIRKLIGFDVAVYRALHQLSLERSASFQELADEAFADLLKKHHRPVSVQQMFRESARLAPVNDTAPSKAPKKKR